MIRWSEPLDSYGRILALQIGDELRECGHFPQVFQVRVHVEKGPTREPGLGGPFQPSDRFLTLSQYRVDARDLIVGVMRVTEGMGAFEGPANTLDG